MSWVRASYSAGQNENGRFGDKVGGNGKGLLTYVVLMKMYSFELASFVPRDFGYIHDVASITNSVHIIDQYHSVVWLYYNKFIHSLALSHLVCF